MRWPWNQVKDDLEDRIEQQNSRINELEDEISNLRQLVMESTSPQIELSDKERELISLYIENPIWRTKQEIAEELNVSKSYAGNLLSECRDKLEFNQRIIDEAGTKSFKLEDSERNKIINTS